MRKYTTYIILLISSVAFADPDKNRISEINSKVNNLNRESMFEFITVTYDLKLPNPAAAFFLGNGHYQIAINKNIFNTLTKVAQDFIGFHELGHIYLGHTEMDPSKKNRYEVELEADTFAAFMYLKFGQKNQDIVDFIDLIETMKDTTPSGEIRAKVIRNIIF